MEKNRTVQLIAILALVVGVIGLSIGFAAFSNTLKIKSSATVAPDKDTLNVDFSSSPTEVEANEITAVSNPVGLITTKATIDNTSDPVIKNLSATFTEPGQKATYSFYAYNAGHLQAYLKSIIYGNVSDNTTNKVCTAKEGTTDALVQKACNGISVKVKVGSEAETNSSVASISNHALTKGQAEPVIVTLEYAQDADRADGDFTVAFGDITLNYSSVD
ncbi:hypothetical protein EGP98_06225 [bacterium]|nr:hypothetical protein [bacterium]